MHGVFLGGQLPPPNILELFVVKHLMVRPGGQSLFSACPPNNFLPDTPLISAARLELSTAYVNLQYVVGDLWHTGFGSVQLCAGGVWRQGSRLHR